MKSLISFVLFFCFLGIIPFFIVHCKHEEHKVSITDISILTVDEDLMELDTTKTYSYLDIYKSIQFSDWESVSYSPKGLLIPQAYATSPAPPTVLQEFNAISIVAQNSFVLDNINEPIAAGTDITEHFVIGLFYFTKFVSIVDFIEVNSVDIYEPYLLRLAVKPTIPTSIMMKITIQMTDGITYDFPGEILKAE